MEKRKIGVWIIGARGSIAAAVMVGALALRRGLADATGMTTASSEFDAMDLVWPGSLEFGGCDVRGGSLVESLHRLARETWPVDRSILDGIEGDLAEIEGQISAGTARNCGEAIERLAGSNVSCRGGLRDEVESVRQSIRSFKSARALHEVVVVNLASTEPPIPILDCHQDLSAFEESLDRGDVDAARASAIYSYAAIREGCPYINFTPSNAALVPAIVQLARAEGVPVMGNDGKTGETLVKSALAPMFACRNLEVLSWEGFNILGNMDGSVLEHPDNRESKIKTKDRVISKILGYNPHSRVHINFVPSLDDQKTAWDFIHFKGFLGVKMSLQFVWQGYDSLLAAPLVLDLVRMAEFAGRRGESGLMPHLASYFKAPLGVEEYRLYEQHRMLLDYAAQAMNR